LLEKNIHEDYNIVVYGITLVLNN